MSEHSPSSARGIPPYVAFRTFWGFLQQLKVNGIPSRIDRSVLSSRSGSVQSQILLALKFFDLITAGGKPTAGLKELLDSEGAQLRKVWGRILLNSYDFLRREEIDLSRTTNPQIETLFQTAGASGETLRRCISFLLSAAREAGWPVSPYVKPHRRKRRAAGSGQSDAPALPDSLTALVKTGEVRRIELNNGGQLALILSVNLFELEPRDREFVFSLIDRMNAYSSRR